MSMRGFITALIAAMAFANSVAACPNYIAPMPDHLRRADTVAKVVLLRAEQEPDGQLDWYVTTDSAILTFRTLRTYSGPHRDEWRALWRGGHTDLVAPPDAMPERDGAAVFGPYGDYHFASQTFSVLLKGRKVLTSLRDGDVYIVGIVPAEKQWGDIGCRLMNGKSLCIRDGDDGFHDELLFEGCHDRKPYAFPFSEVLEARVLDALAEAK